MDSAKSVKFTIYCHTHIDSGRRYVGLTSQTMEKRWKNHVHAAKYSKGKNQYHFANAIRKYGKDAFTHEVLEVHSSLTEANTREEFWIEHFKTRDPQFGFNISPGGSHIPHPVRNPWDRPEYREKMKAVIPKLTAAGLSPEARAKTVAALKTSEFRQKAAELTRQQFSSPESRLKMSETIKALHQIPEIAEKFASGLRSSNAERASKTHCKHGHEFTPENTHTNKNGWRYCKRCACDRACRKAYEKRTHCAKGHKFEDGNFKLSIDGRRICLLCEATHCKHGHEFTSDTVRFDLRGNRACKICERIRGRQSDARRRAKRRALKNSVEIQPSF